MSTPSSVGCDIPPCFHEEVVVKKPVEAVWNHLVNLRSMREWLGGDDYAVSVETTWMRGSAIVIRGMHHLPFENRGVVLSFQPYEEVSFTHLSSLSRLPDQPSSYTTLRFAVHADGDGTVLTFEASGFPTMAIYRHLKFYWAGTLDAFRRYAESR